MGTSVYRRGAPVLAIGAIASAMAAGGIAWGSHMATKVAPPPRSTATTTSEFPELPGEPPRDEPVAKAGDPKSITLPIITQPAGASVWEVDNGRRRKLCAATPCDITVFRERLEKMIVSLELGGFEAARAHPKDVAEIPGGTLSMVFTRAATPAPFDGWGVLSSRRGGSPTLRQGATHVVGSLPTEVIQRIVRQNFGRFRLCYEASLRDKPQLAGRVTVKFVIDRSGAVSSTADGGSDIGDAKMVDCVVKGFANLAFPQPEGSVVTVTYPIIFNPGD